MSAASMTDPGPTISIPVQPLGSPNSANAPTTSADRAVTFARDIPSLIRQAAITDPDLAAKWTGKSLAASKSPWGSLAGGVVSWLVAHYGIGWDAATCDLVAGAGVLIASYVMRAITELPITGIFRAATTSEAVAIAAARPATPPATTAGV